MSDSPRITITKRVSLSGMSDGWGDDCYAIVTPASYQDYDELGNLDTSKLTRAEDIKLQMNIVKKHFVEGKLRPWGSDELVAMQADDVYASVEIANRLYSEIMGLKLDPKDSTAASPDVGTPSATTPTVEPQPNSEDTTGTSSSTALPTTSPSPSSETSTS